MIYRLHFYVILCLPFIYSCEKELQEAPPPFGVPYIYNPSDTNTSEGPTIANTTWVIQQYRIGTLGETISCSDTLIFSGNRNLYYNRYLTQYSSYYTPAGINLTLYETTWGVLSGEVYAYSLQQGIVNGAGFNNILNPNSQTIYLWMQKIK